MSYSTIAKVKSLFRDFGGGSDPAVSDSEIQEFLDDAALIINGRIGLLYQLPIILADSPDSYGILRRIETYIVADIVDDILNSYTEADKKPEWGKKASSLLKDISPPLDKKRGKQLEPAMKLLDAVYLGTSTQRNKITIAKTSGAIFKKGVDNW